MDDDAPLDLCSAVGLKGSRAAVHNDSLVEHRFLRGNRGGKSGRLVGLWACVLGRSSGSTHPHVDLVHVN